MPPSKEPLELAPFWRRLCPSPFAVALALFVGFGGFRLYGYLGDAFVRSELVTIGFGLMWLVPLIFLSPYGRGQIGLAQGPSLKGVVLALFAGIALASLAHFLGLLLYGQGTDNWFMSVAYSYQTDERLALLERPIAFIVFALPSVVASPFGEEVFYRGVVEQSNRHRWSPVAGACFAATLFALVQLTQHGIYRGFDGSLHLLPVSGAIWFALMFASGLVFSYLRHKGQSLWTAILAHSAFNLTMNYYIFFSLLVTQPQTLPAS